MMSIDTLIEEQIDEVVDLEELVKEENHVVLHNDDVNTFDFVIDTLIEICKHDPLQAEQCAFITHYKGRCSVKTGSIKKLKSICQGLCDKGLSATID